MKHGKFSPAYIFSSLLVIALPFISTYTLVTFLLNKPLMRYIPQWSDEVAHWHQVATFRTAGFNGGYYTINEQPAPASFIHYYVHGPVNPVLFGILGRIIGWQFYYAPLINIILLTLAVVWYILVLRPNYLQLLLIGLVLLTFWPTLLFMPTNMRVGTFSAAAIILAVFFCKTITDPESTPKLNLIFFCTLIGVMALFQVSWALLFIPFLLLIRKRIHLSLFQATSASLILIAIFYLIFDWIIAPYPLYFTSQLSLIMQGSIIKGFQSFFQHAIENIRNFFSLDQDPLWLALRAQMLLVIIGSGYLLWEKRNDDALVRESLVVLTNCGLLLIETILLFDILHWRDYRLFAPIVWMVTLILIDRKRMMLIVCMILINLMLIPQFLNTYKDLLSGAFPENQTAIQQFSEEITPVVQFDKNAGGWGNTLLTSPEIAMHQLLLGVPPGIGLSWFTRPVELLTIKSRYLLLDNKDYETLRKRTCLVYKLTTDIGDLYVNDGDKCHN
jgi:hypothetical protein